jgi:hypothetical protein
MKNRLKRINEVVQGYCTPSNTLVFVTTFSVAFVLIYNHQVLKTPIVLEMTQDMLDAAREHGSAIFYNTPKGQIIVHAIFEK